MTTVSVTHQNLISAAGSGPREESSYWLPQVIIIIYSKSDASDLPSELRRDITAIFNLNIGLFNLNTILIIYKDLHLRTVLFMFLQSYHWINQLLLPSNSGHGLAPPIGQSLLSSSDAPISIPPVQSITAYCYFYMNQVVIWLEPPDLLHIGSRKHVGAFPLVPV